MGAYAPARVFLTVSPSIRQQCWDIVQVPNMSPTPVLIPFSEPSLVWPQKETLTRESFMQVFHFLT
jgi:hypothetical protein